MKTRDKILLVLQSISNGQPPTRLFVDGVFANTALLVQRLEAIGVIEVTRASTRATSYALTDFGVGLYDALLSGQVDDSDALGLWRDNPMLGAYAMLTAGKSAQWRHPAELLLLEVAMNQKHPLAQVMQDILLKHGSPVAKAVIKNNCLIDFGMYLRGGQSRDGIRNVTLSAEELALVDTLQERLRALTGDSITMRDAVVFALIQALGTV